LENQPVAIAIAAAAGIATAMHMATSSRIGLLLGSGASSAASGTGKFNDALRASRQASSSDLKA
jgi:hypothetical protein